MHVDNTKELESNNKVEEVKTIQEKTKSEEHQSTGDINKLEISQDFNKKGFTIKNMSDEKSFNKHNESETVVRERCHCRVFRTYEVKPQKTSLEPFLFQKFVTKYN